MKKITIEISEKQHTIMMEHLKMNTALNFENETFSGHSIHLYCTEVGFSWLEVEMNSKVDLGEVKYRVE